MNSPFKLKYFLIIFGLLGCGWVMGCGPALKLEIKERSEVGGEDVYGRFLSRQNEIHDVRGRATITITRHEKKQTFPANIVSDLSSRFRVEGLGFLNTITFFLVSDGSSLWFYLPEERKVWQGQAGENTLFQLTGIWAGLEDITSLLAGNPPVEILKSSQPKIIFEGEKLYRLEVYSPSHELYLIWLDSTWGVAAKMEIWDSDQKLRLAASFGGYKTVDSFQWPSLIECKFPLSQTTMKIVYKTTLLNRGLADNPFLVSYPPSVIIEDFGQREEEKAGELP